MRSAVAVAFLLLVVAGCQSTSAPSGQDEKVQTFGDTTITTSGRVRVDAGTLE
jgi:hypothetical protein